MGIPLEPLNLSDLSSIRVQFARARTRRAWGSILVIKYSGTYRPGSLGEPDARFMLAMGVAGVRAWEPNGVILDLSDLTYRWGNNLECLLEIGSHEFSDVGFPLALVVGPRCERAVRSLLIPPGGESASVMEEILFRDLQHAWDYVEGEIIALYRHMGFDRPLA